MTQVVVPSKAYMNRLILEVHIAYISGKYRRKIYVLDCYKRFVTVLQAACNIITNGL